MPKLMVPREGYVVLTPRSLHPSVPQFLRGQEMTVRVYHVFTTRAGARAYATALSMDPGLTTTVRRVRIEEVLEVQEAQDA